MRSRRYAARRFAPHAAVCAALCAALVAVASCGGADSGPGPTTGPPAVVPAGPVGPVVVGTTYLDPRGWIEYQAGDAPLLLIAPHGGALAPAELPDRSCTGCVVTNDLNTQDLARAVAEAFLRRTGARPHLVVNRLHRRKFDGNRERPEATGGAAALDAPWAYLQAAIDTARGRIATRVPRRGLVIDLHGHGHDIARLELGYLLSASTLRRTDASLDATSELARSSIARLALDAPSRPTASALLRGANSLGGLLVTAGYPAVPSTATPAPLAGEEYFDGGYNTQRTGSVGGGTVDAIQIETHYTGVRDDATSRARFADALAGALARYLELHYGWRGPAAGG